VLGKHFPELKSWPRRYGGSLAVRYAHLTWPLDEAEIELLSERLRAPNDVRELALTAARNKRLLEKQDAEALLQLLKGADAFRRPERFAELLKAAKLADPALDTGRVEKAYAAAAAVDAGAIARDAGRGDIGRRVDEARLKAIRAIG
jgi:tRNA nucleotidyltransferase (CCA-adding enzyme)